MAQHIARRLAEMREETPFNRIVTCSPTMRYFLEEIAHDLSALRDELTFEYLGLHPMQGLRLGSVRAFKPSDQIAIISDVVSSSRLIEEMSAIVVASGASVVGSLTIFRTDFKARIEDRHRFKAAPLEPLSPDNLKNALFVAQMRPPPVCNDVQPLLIDRATVYPDVGGFIDSDFSPLFDFSEILKAQSQRALLTVGTYASNDKWMSLAVDIERLLKKLGPIMKPSILPAFRLGDGKYGGREHWLVTTPSRENRLFTEFLASNLRGEGHSCRIIVVPRSENPNEQYAYFAPERIELPPDQTIFLCLATVSTSEKLRALAAYLAMSGAKSISVLTLLNRMNAASGSFLSRVINLQSGKRREPLLFADVLDPSEFRYSSFFKIHDLSTQDLVRGRHLAEQIVQTYAAECGSVFYAIQARNELKYFEPVEVSTTLFKHDKRLDLRHDEAMSACCAAIGVNPGAVPESVAYANCLEAFLGNKHTDWLTLLLLTPSSKELTYALVRLVALNAALLNIRGFFKHLCRELLSKLEFLEDKKRRIATDQKLLESGTSRKEFDRCRKALSALVEDQLRCMAILAFISTLRIGNRDRNHAIDIVRSMLMLGPNPVDVACSFVSATNPIYLWSITFFADAFSITEDIALDAEEFSTLLASEVSGLSVTGERTSIQDRLFAIYETRMGEPVDLH